VIDPRILVILVVLSGGYYVGEKAVWGIKKVDRAVVHGAKVTGTKIAHAAKRVVGR
jgi:hypothetical protein